VNPPHWGTWNRGIVTHPDSQADRLMQHIWHIKVRRLGSADYEIADIRLDQRRGPVHGEAIAAVVNRETVHVKIVSFNTSQSRSTATYIILADELDDGNPRGHREATEKDFQQ
jgi:hypothetical protein